MEDNKLYEGLPPGYYTLGDGHIHKVPTAGYSKWYRRDGAKYRYNNAQQCIEYWYDGELIEEYPLNFMDWIENPDYWIDHYRDRVMSYVDDFDLASEFGLESKKVCEDGEQTQSFVVAYREGGQDKYSSVQASNSTEALRVFNAAVDKAGRNVNNAHIAVEDVSLDEDMDDLPPMRTYQIVRTFDGEDIELASVEARNEEEAKANAMIALLDAGYYENEVAPEVASGVIRVVEESNLNEATEKKLYEISYLYKYVEEYNEAPFIRSAVYRRSVLVEADTTEDAMDKFYENYGKMAEYSEDGQISDIIIENVYPSLAYYKDKYPYSNKQILN